MTQPRLPRRLAFARATLLLILLVSSAPGENSNGAPLLLDPSNPHYFRYRGKPMVIVTSGEHYGAVLNLDFDYTKYLETLASDGLNGTRTWAGAYCEPASAFNIRSNTLAPLAGRFICPWARSAQPGYANGGNKFDLNRWDEAYFARLRDFMKAAAKRGVIVELNLFCPFYEESMWQLSPMNAANNVNAVGTVARTNVYTLDRHGGLLAVQETMVRKLVTELKDFDNLYYEICNEPYFGGVTLEWQARIAQVIASTEKPLGVRHLISQNIANGRARVEKPTPEVSIFNFHYATPPDTVQLDYGLNAVIGDNETGFNGTTDVAYRTEGWDFMVAGGALYNNLDYSFVAGHEDGTFVYPASQPGGGSKALRRQLGFLARTMRGLDLVQMRPDSERVTAKPALPAGCTARVLAGAKGDCLVYLRTGLGQKKDGPKMQRAFGEGEVSFDLDLGAGDYTAEWLDPALAQARPNSRVKFSHPGGQWHVAVPQFEEDIALLVRRK